MHELIKTAYTCCFLGHRNICETEELRLRLFDVIKDLVINKNVDTFLFGSKSRFNNLCYELVTEIKNAHPHIKRIYVRAEFPIVDDQYKAYLLESYEDTYYPENILGSGRLAYVKRNREMIDRSRFCVFYYDDEYFPTGRNSGTKIAFDYALKCNKPIFLFPHLLTSAQAAIKG